MNGDTELVIGFHLWTANGLRDGALGTDEACVVHCAWIVVADKEVSV